MSGNKATIAKIGKHIAELRKNKGYTQKNLGDILDVSDKTISKWEKGIVAPDITILNSLSKALDISVEELLIGEKIEEDNMVEAIDVYSKISKRKIIKIFILVLIMIMFAIILVFNIERYYSWQLNPIYYKGNISISGYILNNNKESKIIINNFMINNMIDDENFNYNQIKSIDIDVLNNTNVIHHEIINYDSPVIFQDVFTSYSIIFETNEKINKKMLKINILLSDINNHKHSIVGFCGTRGKYL